MGKTRLFPWTLALLLPLFAALPALSNPIEEHAVDAALFHVYRAVVFAAAQADGWLYPRWVPGINGGLGGPLFTFYSPLIYFLMTVFHVAGVPFALTWRLVVALAFMAASLGAFGLGLVLFRRADVALASAALYTYSPYLLRELFERGSPQGMAIALYPWVLWGLLALAESPSGLRLALASVAWAALILTHNAGALLALPVLALWWLFLTLRAGRTGLWMAVLALVGGLLLAAFFLLPFMAERWAVQLANATDRSWASPTTGVMRLSEFFAWPLVFDAGLVNNDTGQTLGPLPAFLIPLTLAAMPLLARRGRGADAVLAGGLALWGAVALWMQTAAATPVWATITPLGIMQYLNFRWRLLASIGLVVALGTGLLLAVAPRRWVGLLAALTAVLGVGIALPSLYPSLLTHHAEVPRDPTLADVREFTLRSGFPDLSYFRELLPRWRTVPFTPDEADRIARSPVSNLPEGGQVLRWERRTGYLEAELETPIAFQGAFHALYFPGWVGYLDGERRPLQPAEGSGYILMDIPPGRHTVLLQYEGTMAQRVGDGVSGITVVVLLALAVLWRRPVAQDLSYAGALDESYATGYLKPRWWVAGSLVGLAALKTFWLDPHTPFLRHHSTCESIHGAQAQVDVWFGETLHLCGYAVSTHRAEPGQEVSVTFWWEISRPVDRGANSFVHLIGPTVNPATGTPLWGQEDKQMGINWWRPGGLYRDTYIFRVAPDAPPGEYRLEVGWWDPETQQRYPPRVVAGEGVALSEWNSLFVSTIVIP
ncbi:MAG: 6-pyruvoyl-tetrahydropterin synthase-related protein [Anaerolineae bacterium]|nr:6-pyruvoyl-tetrahydropterin synthase-related protein [Anaerolineae bacterium]MDW8067310.1 6-pyruvoyl-tetrahydropterin synthase-related protein [Anaerolineae bacterium]